MMISIKHVGTVLACRLKKKYIFHSDSFRFLYVCLPACHSLFAAILAFSAYFRGFAFVRATQDSTI